MATVILTSDPGIFGSIIDEFAFEVSESSDGITVYESNKSNKLLMVAKNFDFTEGIEEISEVLLRYSIEFLISLEHATAFSEHIPVGSVLLCDLMNSLEGPIALWHPNECSVIKKFVNQPISHLFENLAHDNWIIPHCSLLVTSQIVGKPPMKKWLNKVLQVDVNDLHGKGIDSLSRKLGIEYALVRGIVTAVEVNHSDFYMGLQHNAGSPLLLVIFNPFKLITLIKFLNRRSKMRKNASKILRRLLFVEAV